METIELGGERHLRLKDDHINRQTLSSALGSAIESVVCRELRMGMDERQITTALRTGLDHFSGSHAFGDYSFSVFGHEPTSLRIRSQESATGMDLYLGVEINDGERVSKGLLIQAKKRNRLSDPRLMTQCRKMLKLNEEAYVWVYDENSVSVIPASRVLASVDTGKMLRNAIRITDHIDEILQCFSGAENIGVRAVPDRDAELVNMMKRFSAQAAFQLVFERVEY